MGNLSSKLDKLEKMIEGLGETIEVIVLEEPKDIVDEEGKTKVILRLYAL